MSDAAREYWDRRNRCRDAVEKVNGRMDSVESIVSTLRSTETRRSGFAVSYDELTQAVSRACHEILLTRTRDEWSMSFALLATHSLAGLGLAEAAHDENLRSGSLLNLTRLASEGAKALPDRRMVLEAWARPLEKIGNASEPPHVAAPHPLAESYSQAVRTLRDTGPRMAAFSGFYTSGPNGVYLVRPD